LRKQRIGFAGAGAISPFHPGWKTVADTEVVAICDPDAWRITRLMEACYRTAGVPVEES
jgi:hypothetical protein